MNRIEELSEKVESLNKEMDSLRNIDNLYTYYPDDLSTAQSVWNLMSEDEKKNFTDGLITTDAASEGIAEAWLTWIKGSVGAISDEIITRIAERVVYYVEELVSALGDERMDIDGRDINEFDMSLVNGNEISLDNVNVDIDYSDIDLDLYDTKIVEIIKSELKN
tara:strand:+ start:443 stop:934 length:492 start_codon:yes stop_codon:yes gene_type:complete